MAGSRSNKGRRRSRSRSPREKSSHRKKLSTKKEFFSNIDDDSNLNDIIPEPKIECESETDKESEVEKQMMKVLGFTSFGSTKGKKVAGNVMVSFKVNSKTRYRQYMNRKGGFNRPLDPVN